MNKKSKILVAIVGMSGVMSLFMSCGPGFQSYRSADLSSSSDTILDLNCMEEVTELYAQSVKPVLSSHSCQTCHSPVGPANNTGLVLDDSFTDRMQTQRIFGLINPGSSENSLILSKPTGISIHTGGILFSSTSESANQIRSFIQTVSARNFCQVPADTDSAMCTTEDALLKPQIKRLTGTQFRNSMINAFGDIFQSSTFPDWNDGNPTIGFANDPNILGVNEINIISLHESVRGLVTRILSQNSTVQTCVSATSDNCFANLITNFGLNLWRRPVTSLERADLNTLLSTMSSASRADRVQNLLISLIMSPNHIFRSELGTPASGLAGALHELSSYEVAGLLSFSLWDFPPDSTLLQLAASNQLHNQTVLRNQIDRMIVHQRYRQKMANFSVDLLKLENVLTVAKDASFNLTAANRHALLTSARLGLEELAANPNADILSAFSGQRFYLNNQSARFFNLNNASFGADFTSFETDPSQRNGILSHPAFLTSISGQNSSGIVRRGVFTLEQLLCYHIPPAPAEINPVETLPPGTNLDLMTTREILRVTHSSQASCIGCHTNIDPAGFGFENYSPIGQFRIVEKDNLPIDSSGTITGITQGPITFANSVGYLRTLAQTPEVKQCVTKKYFHYISGQSADTDEGSCEHSKFANKVQAKGETLRSLIESFVELESFVRRKPAQE